MNYKDYNDNELFYLVGENSEEALNIIYKKYNPIIKAICKKYLNLAYKIGLEYDDLYQEGMLGLFTAIRKYDETMNILFYTYACLCIKGNIMNLLRKSSSSKQQPINEGISLATEIGESNCLEDFIPSETMGIDLVYFNELQETILDFKHELKNEQSYVFELSMNGFKTNEI